MRFLSRRIRPDGSDNLEHVDGGRVMLGVAYSIMHLLTEIVVAPERLLALLPMEERNGLPKGSSGLGSRSL
jgi:hypothetical protein